MTRTQTAKALFVSVLIAWGLAGCVDVNGGAVELRWEIRKTDGDKTTCAEAQVAGVRLIATPVAGGAPRYHQWPCDAYQGATAFDLPPDRYALSIEPVCTSDAGPPTAQARVPDPLIRDISNGNVAELNTLLIEKLPGIGFICPTP